MNIEKEEVKKLGVFLRRTLDQYTSDRSALEIQWLKNLRQYRGKYDPEVESLIPAERSHVYPRDTRVKVKGGVAKLMEMMFPAQERNWELATSTNPSIPKEALENLIQTLEMQELAAAQAQERDPVPLSSDAIERAVREFADHRRQKMEDEIADQLEDPSVDFPQLCKRVVRSGYIYGFGVARCPMVRTQKERFWELDNMGSYQAKQKTLRRPYPEWVRVWDTYPDLSARSWVDQEMFFERVVLTRHDLNRLAKRDDFFSDVIREYIKEHSSGNYTEKSYEAELRTLDKTSNIGDRSKRRYEVYRGVGFITGHELATAGVEIAEDRLHDDIFADLWFIDNVVIKAEQAAFGTRPSDLYHAFIYTEDEDSGLTGVGLPEEVNDSQMSLCAVTRAMMDNLAATAGPIFEVNVDLLARGRKTIGAIHAFSVIEREGMGQEAQYPAVRDLKTESHISELLAVLAMQRQQLDIESNLPAYTMGNTQAPLGEAFRTSTNMSMMMGSANMVTKDIVRAFDNFTTSLLGSLLAWNLEFNPKEEIKGDYQVRATGTVSLVAKEVRGAALDQFMTTLTAEERAILDTYGLLLDRLKARDLPVNRVLPRAEAEQILSGMRDAAAQAAQVEQGFTAARQEKTQAEAEKKRADTQLLTETADATIQEILSRVDSNLANAESARDRTQLENLRTLLQTATGQGGV